MNMARSPCEDCKRTAWIDCAICKHICLYQAGREVQADARVTQRPLWVSEPPCNCGFPDPSSYTVSIGGCGDMDGDYVRRDRPETCRECAYCSDRPVGGGHTYCHYKAPQVNACDSGKLAVYPRIMPSKPACHLGILSQTPWPKQPEPDANQATDELRDKHCDGCNRAIRCGDGIMAVLMPDGKWKWLCEECIDKRKANTHGEETIQEQAPRQVARNPRA